MEEPHYLHRHPQKPSNMKKILFCLTAIFIIGCTNNKKQETKNDSSKEPVVAEKMEKSAKKELNKLIEEKYPHGFDAQPVLSEYKVLQNDDSLYWSQFNMKYQNQFGGFSNGKFEFLYVLGSLSGNEPYSAGLVNLTDNDRRKFTWTLIELENIAVTKRNIPDSLVYHNKSFEYNVARIWCYTSTTYKD